MVHGMALGDRILERSPRSLPVHLPPPTATYTHTHIPPDPSTDPALAQELLDENQKEVQGTKGTVSPLPSAGPLLAPMQSSSELHLRPHCSWLECQGSSVALNAALKLVLYLLNKYCCSCLSCSLGLWD